MTATVDRVVADGRRVLVVGPPARSEAGRARRAAVSSMLAGRYGSQPAVRAVDIGDDAELAPLLRDGRELTASFTDRVAELITTPLLELMR
jgi:hypothetical protein